MSDVSWSWQRAYKASFAVLSSIPTTNMGNTHSEPSLKLAHDCAPGYYPVATLVDGIREVNCEPIPATTASTATTTATTIPKPFPECPAGQHYHYIDIFVDVVPVCFAGVAPRVLPPTENCKPGERQTTLIYQGTDPAGPYDGKAVLCFQK